MKTLLVENNNAILTITINSAEYMNVLTSEVLDELESALSLAENDPDVRVIVLTGAGDRAFIAGADIKEMVSMGPKQAKAYSEKGHNLTLKMEKFPKPIIAAVNGYALGGGCEFAMACHIRYASENAQFAQPEVGLGVIPGFGGTQRLPRLVGKGRALELLLGGAMINANEAFRIGLVNKVFPHEYLLEGTYKLARLMTKKSEIALNTTIQAVYEGDNTELTKGLSQEAKKFGDIFTSDDQKEGMSAFLEKRKPKF